MKKQGLTLIEMLVVLAIIGFLVSILLVSLGPRPQIKAKDARRQADIGEIMKAMEMCYNDDGQYPNITTVSPTDDRITNASITSGVKTYLSPFPKDPGGGNYYGKANAANRQQYCIYAILESIVPTTYFCASEKGVKSSTTAPSLGACCF
jgi:prepilin-type N-terminal cleavage/methylation domain-containing protein